MAGVTRALAALLPTDWQARPPGCVSGSDPSFRTCFPVVHGQPQKCTLEMAWACAEPTRGTAGTWLRYPLVSASLGYP